MLITPPSNNVPQARPVQTQPVQTQPAQVQPMAQEPVQTVNGKIVYNRKYGDIPKGSYTGGSTYTVKRGDTLFYIAWVTGNDFRDLAQRNNIPAPYGLNVGQTLQVGNASGQPITGDNPVAQASVKASSGGMLTANSAQKSTAVVASQPTITYSESSGEQSANKMLPNNKPATTTTVAPVTAQLSAQPNRLQAVRQPVRRSLHGAGRLMARLSRTLVVPKVAIKVLILQAVKDRLLSRPQMGASSMPVTHCAVTVILLSSNTTMIT
jgi:LysM repeat protein